MATSSLEFGAFLCHALFLHFFLCSIVAHFLRDLHAAELGATHAAKVRGFAAVFGQGFIVEVARGVGVPPQVELVFPAEFKTRF